MDDFTYSGNPTSNPRDAVRYMIGDVTKDDAMISDSEIDFELFQEPQIFVAAANCCDVIAIKLARKTNRQSKTMDLSRGQTGGLHELWIQRAAAIRARVASHVGPIFASDQITLDILGECYPHIFTVGMDDNNFIP